MKLKTDIVKEDDRYKVADDTSLNQLVVSTTKLFAKKKDYRTRTRRTGRSLCIYQRQRRNADR